MTTVVVVDDQQLVRAGLISTLRTQSDVDVVGEAANGRDAIRVVEEADPDVTLMDVRMPGVDGITATQRLSGRRTAIVMLTTFDLDEYVYAAMKAGACGFLLKDTPPESLVNAVRSAARGDSLLAPGLWRYEWPGRQSPRSARRALQWAAMLLSESDVLCRRLGIGDKPPYVAGRD